tara:strand:- start:370 stop:522 length:153 start_codon:yes stop_codon:yes gene_type:complete
MQASNIIQDYYIKFNNLKQLKIMSAALKQKPALTRNLIGAGFRQQLFEVA